MIDRYTVGGEVLLDERSGPAARGSVAVPAQSQNAAHAEQAEFLLVELFDEVAPAACHVDRVGVFRSVR
jgi:hypothetical protein